MKNKRKISKNNAYKNSDKDENTNSNSSQQDRKESSNRNDPSSMQEIQLLVLQLNTQIIGIFIDIILYTVTIKGINLVINPSDNASENVREIDQEILMSAYISLLTTLIFAYIAITRYNTLVEKKERGEFKDTLQPNIDIIASVFIGLISNVFFIRGAEGSLQRDSTQSIFGI